MGTILNDIKYGLRMLAKHPGFTAVVVMIIGLGIGANTALFSAIRSVLLSPLPFRQPQRLVLIRTESEATGHIQACSVLDYRDWSEQNTVFESMCAISEREFTLTDAGAPVTLNSFSVSQDFAKTLGAGLQLGREFTSEEFLHEQHVVILSHQLWQDRFGADPNVLGRDIKLDGVPWRVVGVSQRIMGFIEDFVQLLVPNRMDFGDEQRGHRYLIVFARLKSGVSLEQAQADLDVISGRLSREYVASNKHMQAILHPLHSIIVGTVRTAFLILYAAVGLVLVVACVNASTLLLAKSAARHREVTIRCTLGAGRARLIRQLLTESILLALFGGGLGLALGFWGLHGLRLIAPKAAEITGGQVAGFEEIALNLPVLGFTLVVSVFTGILFGLVPAWKGSDPGMGESLKQAGQFISSSRKHHRIQGLLVIAQIALAVLLLVGAGLLIRSYSQLNRTHLGFEPKQLLAVQIKRSQAFGHGPDDPFFPNLVRELEGLPGIESVTATTVPPLAYNNRYSYPEPVNHPMDLGEKLPAGSRVITSDYFRCLRIPVIKGRSFKSTDNQQGHPVLIVNEAFVDQFLGQEEPLGQLVHVDKTCEIIGIVGNVKTHGLQPKSFIPIIYRPLQQDDGLPGEMTLLIRTISEPRQCIKSVQQTIWDMDSNQPIQSIRTMEGIAADSVSIERFSMILLVFMAGVALLIAVVGLYGVVAYAVNDRQTEIGIRLALGADSRDILILVVKKALVQTVIGLCLGLVGAIAVTRLMTSMLYHTNNYDIVTLLIVTLLLFGVAMLACYLPAHRATKLDPMKVLRYE
ncbi:ABC transporter permease [Planctomycetota bacterium]